MNWPLLALGAVGAFVVGGLIGVLLGFLDRAGYAIDEHPQLSVSDGPARVDTAA